MVRELIQGVHSLGNNEPCHVSLMSVGDVCHELHASKILGPTRQEILTTCRDLARGTAK